MSYEEKGMYAIYTYQPSACEKSEHFRRKMTQSHKCKIKQIKTLRSLLKKPFTHTCLVNDCIYLLQSMSLSLIENIESTFCRFIYFRQDKVLDLLLLRIGFEYRIHHSLRGFCMCAITHFEYDFRTLYNVYRHYFHNVSINSCF